MSHPAPVTQRSPAPPPAVDIARYLPHTTVTDTPLPDPAADWPRVRGYELLGVLGRGGMGVVYKARHRELGRTVALKLLRGAALTDSEFRERFQAEATAAAKLQHPNVVQVFEVGTAEPRPGGGLAPPYIALEFVDGGDLTRLTDDPQPPAVAARLVEKLACAAHAAHRLGVVHRDLKPANVLLTPAGEPKIADFGIAKQLGADDDRLLTRAGSAVGTPEYMAPEQVCGGRPTPAIDTYALGVILYELLTGRVPYHGVDAAATMDLVWKQEPVSPRQLQPGLPRDLETVCLKCLDKVPSRRYASAEALADDLARWAAGRPILARPVGPAGRLARWAGRNPAVAGLSAAVVAVALAGLGGVVWGWREARESAAEARGHAAAERWERYRAEIVAATGSLRLNDARAARRALEAAPAEYRGWEWRHAVGRLDAARLTLAAPEVGGARAQVSPDGRYAATAAGPAVRVWDTRTGRLVGAVADSTSLDRFTLSPDGVTLASNPVGAEANTAQLWDVASGRVRTVLRGHPAVVHTIHFSPDGRRVATGSLDGSVRMWDSASGAELFALPAGPAACGSITFDPEGRRMAVPVPAAGTVHVRDAATGRLLHRLADPGADLCAVVFGPDPELVAVCEAQARQRVRLWSLGRGEPVAELPGHTNRITSSAFSPDGRLFVTASLDQTVRLWEVPTGRLVADLHRHAGKVFAVAFSPDGRRLATASQDQTVRLWDARTGAERAVLHGHLGEVLAVGFTADGRDIVSASRDGSVKVWDAAGVERGGAISGHRSFVYGVAYHPDGWRVASASWDGTVRLWDAATGRRERQLRHADGKPAVSVAVHPAGKLVASLGRDQAVRLWDADTGDQLHHWPVPAHGWLDGRLAFSPAGDLLAVGAGAGGVRLFDPHTRAEVAVLPCPTTAGRAVAFSPDGRWLAAGADDPDPVVRVWDVARRTEVRVLTGHTERVYAVAFSPTGGLLVSGSTDGTIRLWDTASWEPVVLRPDSPVYAVAFTPDGQRLAAGCADNTIRLWDVASRQEVGGLNGHTNYVHALAFSPDGRRLVSGSGDATLRVWDAHQPPDGRPSQTAPEK